ncbi:exonuclease domain-containing protein [Glaciecola sp. 1036]|uniref:3'-5' exonuclease n=1 Tax=Alteromonadaceae TaxID=72275 RepID=UPI003D088EF9
MQEQAIATRLPPIIDVEASGFGINSFPIEIGVVLENGSRFCRLIRPFNDWVHWDDEAQKIHGISQLMLAKKGVDPVIVCHELNRFVGNQVLYSDAWVVDNPWVNTLFYRAGVPMQFSISSLELILKEQQLGTWDRDKAFVLRRSGLKRHRASTDACIIQLTYERSLQRMLNT